MAQQQVAFEYITLEIRSLLGLQRQETALDFCVYDFDLGGHVKLSAFDSIDSGFAFGVKRTNTEQEKRLSAHKSSTWLFVQTDRLPA